MRAPESVDRHQESADTAGVRFEDIRLVTPDLIRASGEDVARAESHLGCRFPEGYAEYAQQLGEGTLNDLVYVWMPQRIVERLPESRAIWDSFNDFWPWDDPESQVGQDRVRESIVLGDTNAGDLYCFHPDDPDTVIIAPRDLETTFAVGPGLGAALEWTFDSGHLIRPEPIAEFHAHVTIRTVNFKAEVTTMPAARDSVASITGAATVHQVYPDRASVYFPAVKGVIRLYDFSDRGIHVQLEYQMDAPEGDADDLQLALSRAGFHYETAW
jgi:hypothetical protein